MRLALVMAGLALAGCQTPPNVDQLRAQAPMQSDFSICKTLVVGNALMQQLASEEQQRRRLDCAPHMPTIQTQIQNDANRAAMGLQMLQMSRPQPLPMPTYQMPQPISCSSRNVMGTVYTDCR